MTDSKEWFEQGKEYERERIIALLEADKCELEDKCTCSATIAHMVATIKGEN